MPFKAFKIIVLLFCAVGMHSASARSTDTVLSGEKTGLAITRDTTGFRINHMSPVNTRVNNQIWSVKESALGWVFFAEEEGILAVRGRDSRLITTPNASTVRSLAVQTKGDSEVLYYGEQGDFGFVEIDSSGTGLARSLKHLVPDSIDFGDIWNAHVVNDQVFFQSRSFIFRLSSDEIAYWQSENGYHNTFQVEDRYFVREFGVGLKEFNGVDFALVRGGEILKGDLVSGITKQSNGDLHVWTQNQGIMVLDKSGELSSKTRYSTELQIIAERFRLYSTKRLDRYRHVIATLGAGLLVVDSDGEILKRLTRESGFPDDSQNYLHPSRFGGLWVGLDNEGVAYLDNDLVRVAYNSDNGLSGYINDLDMVGGHIYVSTGAGVFRSSLPTEHFASEKFFYSKGAKNEDFEAVTNLPIVWALQEWNGRIVLASESGVYVGSALAPEIDFKPCWYEGKENGALPLQAFSLLLEEGQKEGFVGLQNGLAKIVLVSGQCVLERIDLGLEDFEVRSIALQGTTLWLGTAISGFIAVENFGAVGHSWDVFQSVSHQPGRNDVINWSGRMFGYNSSGIFDLSVEDGNVLVSSVNGPASVIDDISVLTHSLDGTGWVVTRDHTLMLGLRYGQLEVLFEPDALDLTKSSTSSILVDSTKVVWFNNGSELLRYDRRYDVPGSKVFHAHISRVSVASTGQVLFDGFYPSDQGGIAMVQETRMIPSLDFESRSLEFQFSATEFIDPEAVQYRFRVDGSDIDWTEWEFEVEAMISSLSEGSYTLEVQAMDEIGRLSSTASYSFVILPPWYRSMWAYLAYLVLGVSSLISSRKYLQMRRAHKMAAEQAKELEREREVVKKLSEANDRLKQANKLKDEFLATTSHELRTPLTAILGFTSVLKDEIPRDAEYREFLDIIEDSGSRLMDTLNSLLDLAKLRAGIMDINMESMDLFQTTFQEIVRLQDAAAKKGLRLRVRRPEKTLYVEADMHGFHRVIHNLVGNAIKFTDEGSVEIWFEEHRDRVDIHVTDTGIGIEEQFLPDLFNAFIQESDGLARTYEGTGLGLAITSGIVHLMNASIRVNSTKGEGSDFIVSLRKVDGPRRQPRRMPGMGNRANA